MAVTPKNTIKSWFETLDMPTQDQFWSWIDSYWHKQESIPISEIENLSSALSAKANTSDVVALSQGLNAEINAREQAVMAEANTRYFADNMKVDKIEGKGLSTNDYTDSEKLKVTNAATQSALSSEITARTNADIALSNRLDDQEHESYDSADTGLVQFDTTDPNAALYSVTGTTGAYVFNLLIGGHGRIKGVFRSFSAGQSVPFATSYNCLFCCINASGQLITTNTIDFSTMFPLWQLFTGDSGAYYVGWEGHPYSFTSNVSAFLYRTLGTVISGEGGNIAAVTPQSGATIGHLKIVGDALLEDHGLTTNIYDSAGSGVTFIQDIRKSTGAWSAYANQQQILPRYNLANVATAIPAGKNGAFLIYAAKGDGRFLSTNARYLCLAQNQVYNTAAIAVNDLNAFFGKQTTTIIAADGLLTTIEVCLLGGIVLDSTGAIVNVIANKKTAVSGGTGGGGALAAVAYSGEHSQLVNQNADSNFRHITTAEKAIYDALEVESRTWYEIFTSDWIITDGVEFTQPYNFSIDAGNLVNGIVKYKSDRTTYSPGYTVTSGTKMLLYPISVPIDTKVVFTKK